MIRLAIVAVFLSALVGCGPEGRDEGAPEPPKIVVAGFYPLAWAARQVAGGLIEEVVDLTPAGVEPHDLELSSRDIEAIEDAYLVLYVGSGFQPALEDAIENRAGPSYDALAGVHGDPHVWLDPIAFARIVQEVAKRVGGAGSADDEIRELKELDGEYRRGLARCDRRTLVTSHAAFGRLADRYGLEQLSLSGASPEAEPGPRELERLIHEVRASGATTVFAEPLVSDRVAETVAREAGIEVAVLDPLEGLSEDRLAAGEDYLSVMRQNLAALEKALGCR